VIRISQNKSSNRLGFHNQQNKFSCRLLIHTLQNTTSLYFPELDSHTSLCKLLSLPAIHIELHKLLHRLDFRIVPNRFFAKKKTTQ